MGKAMIEVCTVRSEEPSDFLFKLHRKYSLTIEVDFFGEDLNNLPGYDCRSTKNDITEIESFSVPKGTKAEEVESICKNLGFMRLIDPLEFLHLVKRHRKFMYENGDPNQVQLPYGVIRTQWQNQNGVWCFMEYETGVLVMDRIFFEDGIVDECEKWNFMGVRNCKVLYDRSLMTSI